MSDQNDNLSGEELSLSDLEEVAGGATPINNLCHNWNCGGTEQNVICGSPPPPPSTT